MELSTEKQIIDQLTRANKVLVALPQVLTADSVASGLALTQFLKKLDKDAVLVSSGQLLENLKFLPQADSLSSNVKAGKSLVINVDTSQRKLEELSYQSVDQRAQIFLKADVGTFEATDISFTADKFPVDVIVVLDAKSLEDLGALFEKNTDLFFETPKINIDNKPGNEYFGAINFVDIAASSVAEILASLFEKFENQLVDENIATCLLAGIVTKTQSFQHAQTTPKAFLAASQLVALGARQQEIVKQLFKTKSLALLKLWGRTLARLQTKAENSLVYSLLSNADFEKAGAGEWELPAVLQDLQDTVSGYNIVAILAEVEADKIRFLAAVHPQVKAEELVKAVGVEGKVTDLPPGPYKIIEAEFSGVSLAEAENKFLGAIQNL